MKSLKLGLAVAAVALVISQSASLAITVVVNGRTLPSDPPPVEVSDRVLLPMRMVFEALQATVDWEAATQTAEAVRGNTTVRMTINQATAYVSGEAVALDVPPKLINGHTYVPVRFPAEAFGAEVGWEPTTQTVTIALAALPGQPAPPPAEGSHVGAPLVYSPQEGDRLGPRTEISLKSTPGIIQVIWTDVKRVDTGKVLRSVPGIRHLTKADGTYQGAIATPRIFLGERDEDILYEIHFRNGPNPGDPETVIICYPKGS